MGACRDWRAAQALARCLTQLVADWLVVLQHRSVLLCLASCSPFPMSFPRCRLESRPLYLGCDGRAVPSWQRPKTGGTGHPRG
jgi:hypothetical protein